VIPQTLELQVYGAHGALGRFTAAPFPDATLAQDGTILPLSVTSALVGVVWHTLPTLDIYSCAGGESRCGLQERRHGAVRLRQPAL
jgi:hypothetical protein